MPSQNNKTKLKKNEPVRLKQKYIDKLLEDKKYIAKLAVTNGVTEITATMWLKTNDVKLTQLTNLNLLGETVGPRDAIAWLDALMENAY